MATKNANNETVEHLGTRVQELRQGKAYTQAKLAEQVGISQGYLSEVENGNELPGRDVLFRLSENLDATVDYLRYGSTQPPQDVRIRKAMKWIESQDKPTQEFVLNAIDELKFFLETKNRTA